MKNKLPEGWIMMKLMDISKDISAGGTPSRDKKEYWENGTIPWLKIADMKSLYIKKTEEKITKLGLDNSSAKLFPKGTLVYSKFSINKNEIDFVMESKEMRERACYGVDELFNISINFL